MLPVTCTRAVLRRILLPVNVKPRFHWRRGTTRGYAISDMFNKEKREENMKQLMKTKKKKQEAL